MLFNSAISMLSSVGIMMQMGALTQRTPFCCWTWPSALIRAYTQTSTADCIPCLPCERAAKERMPPILMTTLTMAFGMVSPALAVTESLVQRAPMDQAVIGGAITSSLPVVYCYLDDFQQ